MIDFIHVLEYPWKAAWCFHAPRDPAMEDWVIAQALDILHGRTGEVITRIQALAAEHPPKPGGEHAKIIRKTLFDLQNKQAGMDYPPGPGRRLADRHRRHRGRLPPPGPGPDGHHRRPLVDHPEFGGDSILPRCSRLGDCCLPRYRRMAEPRSDHFSAFVLSNICPPALSSCPA